MTERHAGYVVTFDRNIREYDAEYVINAIRMIKGVISVTPVMDDPALTIAEERVNRIWKDRIYALLKEKQP